KGFGWAADTLRENPEAATAIIGMTDTIANSVWSLMAVAEGGLEVVNPSTSGKESPEFSMDYYASEFEAGVKRLIRDKETLGEGVDAIQQGAVDLFLETVKDSDVSPEKAALYATIAASGVIITRVYAKRLTGGSGNTRKEVNELADTLDNLSNEVNFVARKVEAEKVARSMPYGSREWRDNYDSFYGNENVTSTTIPPYSAKNVKLAGKRHPDTDVVYDLRGFPIFDDIAKYDTRLPLSDFKSASYQTQMRMATRDLRDQIEKNQQIKTTFDADQLHAIQSGKANIPRLTWHHHQDSGRMQLVDRDTHKLTGHVGGEAISEGQ
ncbi:HNH endonuclease, partial [Kiloniella laminariae]